MEAQGPERLAQLERPVLRKDDHVQVVVVMGGWPCLRFLRTAAAAAAAAAAATAAAAAAVVVGHGCCDRMSWSKPV